jgi:hypothetical protein
MVNLPPDPVRVKNPSIIIEEAQRESQTQMSAISAKRESKSFEGPLNGSYVYEKHNVGNMSKDSSVEHFKGININVPNPL